jgi:hypothetical protein
MTVTVVNGQPPVQIVVNRPPTIVVTQTPGVGPPGGGGGSAFTFTQASPATTWTINHNLGYRPVVELFSAGGVEMIAEVVHTTVNQVVVSFVVATAGSARLL